METELVRNEIYDENGLVRVEFIEREVENIEEQIANKEQELLNMYNELIELKSRLENNL